MPSDHVAVAFSMFMSLGVARLLDGLRLALVPPARYWVHTVWVVQKLVGQAFYWWMFWWLRNGVEWTAASFLWILLAPALIFLQATTLVSTHPGTVTSWREHFFTVRRWFFWVEISLILHSVVTSSVLRAIPLWDPFRVVQVAGLATAILGAASAKPRLHGAIAPVALVVQVFGLGSLFFRP